MVHVGTGLYKSFCIVDWDSSKEEEVDFYFHPNDGAFEVSKLLVFCILWLLSTDSVLNRSFNQGCHVDGRLECHANSTI